MSLLAMYPEFRNMGKNIIQYLPENISEIDRFIFTLKFIP
jgi:hypothetical protein